MMRLRINSFGPIFGLIFGALGIAAGACGEHSQPGSESAGAALSTTITNGGFESGLTGWSSTGATSNSTTAHSGAASAQVGSTSNGSTSSLAQSFTAGSGATLSFWYQGHCNDTVTYAYASATLKDTTSNTSTTLLANTCTNNSTWVQVTSGTLTSGHNYTLTLSNKSETYQTDYNYTLYDDVVLTGGTVSNDFSVALSPTSATVAAGSSATLTVNTTITSGSAQSISLAASGLPAGVTASFNPASVTAGSSSTLTLTAASSAAAASATITVTGTATSGSHSATASLTVTAGSTGGGGLANGGFESGLTGWTASGASETVATSGCHGGASCAQLGSTSATNGDSSLSQTFTAPSGTTGISLWYKETCPDTVTYDWATVTLMDNTAGTTATLLAKTCATNSWTQVTGSMTGGHSYTLTLTSHDDNYSGDPTYTLYDDVTLTGSTGGGNDFSIAVSPGSASVSAGSSVAYTVSTAVTSGSAQSVALAVSGLPSGVTGSFSPASVTAGGSATLTLTAASSAAATSATFSVTGTATSGSHTASATVSVTPASSGVGPNGGTVDHLFFAVVGDTRPGNIDDTANYPTAIIDKIFQDLQAMSPRPQFVVTTGDYMYANTTANTAQPQMNLYTTAKGAYSGTVFAAMGNHECDGFTADNCTSLSQSQNIQAFMSGLVTPLGKSLPYYTINIEATDGSWSAKLINVACNYWSSTQQTWLQQQLATATTYTILMRHEPASATTGPCVNAAEQLMTQYPYNLSLVGHTHTFSLSGKEVIVGNGGAPQTAVPYGYATVERLSTGWQIKQYDYSSGLPVNTYTVP